MTTENKSQEEIIAPKSGEEEGEAGAESISIPKADYEKLNQDLGSLKRELKDLKKPKADANETSKINDKPDDNRLMELATKSFLRSAGIAKEKEVELALSLSKKWSIPVDDLVTDEDFQVRLEKLRTSESNALATSNVKGGSGGATQAKLTSEYWIAKGVPPTAADVPDRKTRVKIVQAMMGKDKGGDMKFYNQ